MDDSLLLLERALRGKRRSTRVFFRDDDGGWADKNLGDLGRCMSRIGAPLDIAVIPEAISSETLVTIAELCDQNPHGVRVHQHGFRHESYEIEGRKCEFGSARSLAQQRCDIAAGKSHLESLFGDELLPIFTPPWNRCDSTTTAALEDLGYRALSRIIGSIPLEYGRVQAVDVHIDWFKRRNRRRLNWNDFCAYATAQLVAFEVVGVMLHHQHMDPGEYSRLSSFIQLLEAIPNISLCGMNELLEETGAS